MSEHANWEKSIERYYARAWELAECDAQIRELRPIEAVKQAVRRPGLSHSEIIATALRGYAERPALAERTYEIAIDESGQHVRNYLPGYTSLSYGELRERVEALASAWRHHPKHRVAVNDFVMILGFTGIDFVTVEFAAAFSHAATVPLQASLAGGRLEGIVEDTAPVMVVVTVKDLAVAARLAITNGTIPSLVVMDYDSRVDAERTIFEAALAEIERAGVAISLTTLDALIGFGRAHRWEALPPHEHGAERMALLIHSSGSTGTPKGVIIPERTANLAWVGGLEQVPTVAMAFAPLDHFTGRHSVFGTLTLGGTVCFTMKSDLSTLFEDIRLARPTYISFFPRIFEVVHQHYLSEVVRRTDAGRDAATADAEVRAEMRASFLGDRLLGGAVGSAPTAPEVKTFMRECFDIMLIEGYGSTESGIMTMMEGRLLRPPVIDYKLCDVPELGYYSTDKPYPRGEFCVKSSLASPGYFKRPEATAALFDEEGYLRTGDIMEERGHDNLAIIDRRNDVLKLSQAEFVAVGPLGATFESGSAVIKQIYIYGNSARSYVLAVVVPDMEVVAKLVGPDPDEAELKALIRAEMQKVARNSKLKTFEVPRDFVVEMEPFSFENGLLSSVRKRMRPNLKRKYGDRLEELYVQIERKRHEELMALKNPSSPYTVLEKMVKALEASLGIEGIDPQTTLTFAELGGDSLGSVSFSMFLEDIFGVELPVNAIVSPAGNPRRWAQMIESALGGATGTPTFESVHGKDARTLHAKDLTIDRFLDRQTQDAIPAEEPPADARTVLLTGANGFLGRFLCLSWLERLAPVGGKLICLIRAGNDAAARRRLDEVFAGVDPELERHYRALATTHLEVIAGDVAEPRFGLASDVWDRLAGEVERIVHPAALVNHMLSYEHLFAPNVFGTAELIRLALTRRQKRFDFVSSMAVSLLVDNGAGNNEDSPLVDSVPLSDVYASGYGASKWASETLLQNAHRRFGLPVNVFRGDMMLPHRRYHGQINVPDMFTRLLFSIIMTGLAPASFYEPGPDGRRAKAHYDGLPVDFIADAMVGLSASAHRDIRTYNVVNHHLDDGISLDTVVDWIESAGYAVERMPDHAEWVRRFEAKLGTLTESQRQHSSLAIMGYFARLHPAQEPLVGSQHFVAAVRNLPIGPEVPHLTERFIHKYLDDMQRLGLIGSARNAPIAAVSGA